MDHYVGEPAPDPIVEPARAPAASRDFLSAMLRRRSIRHFSDRPVDRSLIENALAVANGAPSGANRQPWHFVVVTRPDVKREIRRRAEEEEKAFYEGRAPQEWLDALAPLGTDWHKPFLETAPYLIVVFEVHKGDGSPKPYYVKESVGIAVGFLLAALHHSGLAALTHTPSPMRFLNEILDRPPTERPFVLVPVGHQAGNAEVPALSKKATTEVTTWL